MKEVRSDVDAWLLNFARIPVVSRKEFYEKRDGGIRLTRKLTPFQDKTVSLWSNKIEPVVERVIAILLENGSLERKDAIQPVIDKNMMF